MCGDTSVPMSWIPLRLPKLRHSRQPHDVVVPYDSLTLRFRQTPTPDVLQDAMDGRLLFSSSSTPTVPYSTADILYGNEVNRASQFEEFRQNSFIDFEKERNLNRQRSRDLEQSNNRRPPSSSNRESRKSLSIEKVSIDRDENLRQTPTLPPAKSVNQFRPNGLRNSILKGREADELIAMGTLWNPNIPQRNSAVSITNSTTATNIPSASRAPPSLSTTASSSSTIITPPTRKFGSTNARPILVGNTQSSGTRNAKEVEPKYADPVPGAPASFQQRLIELAALEAETVRWEKSKKVKRKKQDRDS